MIAKTARERSKGKINCLHMRLLFEWCLEEAREVARKLEKTAKKNRSKLITLFTETRKIKAGTSYEA